MPRQYPALLALRPDQLWYNRLPDKMEDPPKQAEEDVKAQELEEDLPYIMEMPQLSWKTMVDAKKTEKKLDKDANEPKKMEKIGAKKSPKTPITVKLMPYPEAESIPASSFKRIVLFFMLFVMSGILLSMIFLRYLSPIKGTVRQHCPFNDHTINYLLVAEILSNVIFMVAMARSIHLPDGSPHYLTSIALVNLVITAIGCMGTNMVLSNLGENSLTLEFEFKQNVMIHMIVVVAQCIVLHAHKEVKSARSTRRYNADAEIGRFCGYPHYRVQNSLRLIDPHFDLNNNCLKIQNSG